MSRAWGAGLIAWLCSPRLGCASRLSTSLDRRGDAAADDCVADCSPACPGCDPVYLLPAGKEKKKQTVTWQGPGGQTKQSVVVPGQKLRDVARVRPDLALALPLS